MVKREYGKTKCCVLVYEKKKRCAKLIRIRMLFEEWKLNRRTYNSGSSSDLYADAIKAKIGSVNTGGYVKEQRNDRKSSVLL